MPFCAISGTRQATEELLLPTGHDILGLLTVLFLSSSHLRMELKSENCEPTMCSFKN